MTNTLTAEYLDLRQIAELTGVKYATIKAYHVRRECGLPEPAGRLENTPQVGRSAPYWHRSDIEAWMAARRGPGHYERTGIARGTYQASWPPEACPECGKTVRVNLDGTLRSHGPFYPRCPGSRVKREAERATS